MKGIGITIAVFSVLALAIPLIALSGNKTLQYPKSDNSSGISNINSIETFKVLNVKTNKIETLGAIDYVCGVVAAEIYPSFQTEALKAQAVASFSYAVYRLEYNKKNPNATSQFKGADFSTDSANCEAYISKDDAKKLWGKTFDYDWNKIHDAVTSVANKIMVYNNEPIAAVYCAMSSGITESSKDVWGTDVPYLVEVQSVGDTLAPSFETKVNITQDKFKQLVLAKYSNAVFSATPAQWIDKFVRSNAGGVITAEVCGKSLRGEDIRALFNLRSANFVLTYKNNTFTFDVKGYGHGVGMSQNGSNYMALQGRKWDEILNWYYKGVQIVNYDDFKIQQQTNEAA
jgi:stage II sporulation protein D